MGILQVKAPGLKAEAGNMTCKSIYNNQCSARRNTCCFTCESITLLIQEQGQQPNLFFICVSQAWPSFVSHNFYSFLFAFHCGILASLSNHATMNYLYLLVLSQEECPVLIADIAAFLGNPCIIDRRKKLAKIVFPSVAITEVMSTFTAAVAEA